MQVKIASSDPARTAAAALAVPLFELDPKKWRLPARVARLDKALDGAISTALRSGDFRGRESDSLTLYPGSAVAAERVVLMGLGAENAANADALRRLAGRAVTAVTSRGGGGLALLVPGLRRMRAPASARALAEGAVLGSYRFDEHKGKQEEEPPGRLETLTLLYDRAADARSARPGAGAGVAVAESQNVARDLSNQPGNALPPAALAREAQRVAREVGLRCRVLGVDQMKKRGMGAILAVGQGSANPPRMIVLEHGRPPKGSRRRPTLCLVGKGITFDSGGISIKPAASMGDMKHDMSGAAAVVGALRAAALLRLPLHVVGIIGAAENLPGGKAYRPGDVVRAMSGTTIEVLNTDAEGRVVLADALHYARTEFEPDAMVDLATLTGACVIALGGWCSGVFGNDDPLVERLRKAGEASGERVWPLPLWEEHRKHIKSRVGDIKNTGGRDAGAATAAAFLSYFTKGTPWAHLDIAGTAWTDKAGPIQAPGATGVGVRLLVEFLERWRKG